MPNEQRLKELGALAKIFAEFQGPQIEQAQLAQRGQQGDVSAMLNALGLVQQRKEAEQRATEAQVRNDIAMKQLGLTERGVAMGEQKAPAELAQLGAETAATQQKTTMAPRLAGIEEEKNRIAGATQRTSEVSGQQNRLVDVLQLLSDPSRAGSQGLIGQGVQGQPGLEGVSQALNQQEEQKRKTKEAALAPALRAQQGQGAAQQGGAAIPIQNLPGELFGRSVVDLIPNLANTVNPMAEGALGALGMPANLGRVPSWWEAYKRMVTPQQ